MARRHWLIIIRIEKDSLRNTLLSTQNDIKNYLPILTQPTSISIHVSDTMFLPTRFPVEDTDVWDEDSIEPSKG
jgi:hypothetical protein